MTTFSKSKRISNFQSNYIMTKKNNNSDINNILTKSMKIQFI